MKVLIRIARRHLGAFVGCRRLPGDLPGRLSGRPEGECHAQSETPPPSVGQRVPAGGLGQVTKRTLPFHGASSIVGFRGAKGDTPFTGRW